MTTTNEELAAIANELIDAGITRAQAITEFDRVYIKTAIDKSKGNLTLAAQKAGVHRNTLMAQRTRLLGPSREQQRRTQRSRRR